MIFNNGTTNGNLNYKELCKEEHTVRIAHNNDPDLFEIDNITNTMVEYPYWWPIVNGWSEKSHEYVILKSFFANYNIKPTWINCNYTWRWFDEETGHWTGAVGQVKIYSTIHIIVKPQA